MKRLIALMVCAVSLGVAAQSDDMSQQGFTQVHQSDSTIFWLSDQAFSFVEAQALAASLGAHLATFSTLAESNAVSNAINSANVLFGLYQDSEAPSYAEPAGGWTWVTGEEFNWSNWDSNQPNNTSSVYGEESVGHLRDNQKWNDVAMLYDGYQVLLETPNIPGCTSPNACNFDPLATSDDGTCKLSGCMDTQACNFDAEAACDDDSCDYSCCPGPGCCTEGMYWDWELSGCYNINPADINLDGCVQLNDLLDLLSAFGTCAFWQCGDPIGYHGFDYATVLIGEQCWFAENLQSEQYLNGDSIEIWQNEAQWISADFGMMGVLGQSDSCFGAYGIHIQCPNPDDWLVEHGRLYNWYAVDDERGLCPNGWHVPSSYEFLALTDELGGAEVAGVMLKSVDGWIEGGNGTNSVGFNAKPSGGISAYEPNFGTSQNPGVTTAFWTSTMQTNASAYMRGMIFNVDYVTDFSRVLNEGQSVRCIKDAE